MVGRCKPNVEKRKNVSWSQSLSNQNRAQGTKPGTADWDNLSKKNGFANHHTIHHWIHWNREHDNITTSCEKLTWKPVLPGLKIFLSIAQLLKCIHRDQGHISEINDSSRDSQKKIVLKFHKFIYGKFFNQIGKTHTELGWIFFRTKKKFEEKSKYKIKWNII